MRVLVDPRQADVHPGVPLMVIITITNTTTVIGGYAVRVLGADPGWVDLDDAPISLFPEESRTLTVSVTVPTGIPAGLRRIAVQVRELTPPHDSTVAEIDLTVPEARSVRLRLDPLTVTAGRRAAFSVVAENTGNTQLSGRLAGDDPEGQVRFDFEPDVLRLAPGEHAVLDLRATARRPFMGSPLVRVLGLYLDEVPVDPFFADPDPDPDQKIARAEQGALANGTFIQRPLLSRGPISLVGLLAAITVFAVVITLALSRLVSQSAADRDLALQVAQARDQAATVGTSGMAGTVRLLTSGAAVPGVSVSAFAASDTTTAIATTATDAQGAYAFTNLAAGTFKLSFRGAGFVQLWYPNAATDADATAVDLKAGQQQAGLDVRVGGVPATIAGTVVGDDVSTATLYLMTSTGAAAPTTPTPTTASGSGSSGSGSSGSGSSGSGPPDNGEAVVRTVPIGSDGTFTLTNVPSPSVYDLVVTKTGYAMSSQRIDIGAGENRTGVEIRLLQGDGLITGHVDDATGPLGGVTLTATSGQTTVSTVSLTTDDVGAFRLRSLPTPASFTIVASKKGYASQTLTLTLAAGQKLTGVAITMGQSAGSLGGMVTLAPTGSPGAGVTVTVTDGNLTVQTVTESSGIPGAWTTGGLAVPGAYTVTFSRTDLAPQTVAVSLDASGNITPGSQGATISGNNVNVQMSSATATVSGVITQPAQPNAAVAPLGEAVVTLNSGTSSYTVHSASVPAANRGAYRIERVPPGTYTLTVTGSGGTSPSSQVLTLAAADVVRHNVQLAAPASLSGTVTGTTPTAPPRVGWTVTIYLATGYPSVVAATTITDASGRFAFADIDAANYIIEVRPTPASPPVKSVTKTVQPSQVNTVNIKADPGG